MATSVQAYKLAATDELKAICSPLEAAETMEATFTFSASIRSMPMGNCGLREGQSMSLSHTFTPLDKYGKPIRLLIAQNTAVKEFFSEKLLPGLRDEVIAAYNKWLAAETGGRPLVMSDRFCDENQSGFLAARTYQVITRVLNTGILMYSPPFFNVQHGERVERGARSYFNIVAVWYPPVYGNKNNTTIYGHEEDVYPYIVNFTDREKIGGKENYDAWVKYLKGNPPPAHYAKDFGVIADTIKKQIEATKKKEPKNEKL